MCGRFVNHNSLSKIEKTFNVDTVTCDAVENYNVAPEQEVLSVIRYSDTRLGKLHWGFVPHWSKDLSMGIRMINARSETLSEKPSFRDAFEKRRCLIVADGFYEWKGEKGNKQPWYITLPEDAPFGFAGLWEIWKGGESEYKSCTIITTDASESIKGIHHRMPVVLKPEAYDSWLDPGNHNVEELNRILKDGAVNDFKYYPVSKRVNTVRNNDEKCIAPLEKNER